MDVVVVVTVAFYVNPALVLIFCLYDSSADQMMIKQ
jgi:hypothetical protein